jgi:hypothetical protein
LGKNCFRRKYLKKRWIVIPIVFTLAAGCATQRKVIIKETGVEVLEVKQMLANVYDRDWNGPLARLKENMTDQLKRTETGLENGKITNVEAADIISKADEVMAKIDEMAKTVGQYSGQRGAGGGNPAGGGMGGGHGHHHGGGGAGASGNGESHGQPEEFMQLKTMIDDYYSNTVTASAESLTSTVTASPGETGIQVNK